MPVNCGAIPGELMESEFFGHKKGSFTGAQSDKDGLFQAANGGTLFLDEVAELPMHMQVKLLRVIQEKAVRPIGGRAELPVDVRILSATHKDLGKLVEAHQFRQDLYYRINVDVELRVPPLRARREDIPKLAGKVLDRLAKDNGTTSARLTPESAGCAAQIPLPRQRTRTRERCSSVPSRCARTTRSHPMRPASYLPRRYRLETTTAGAGRGDRRRGRQRRGRPRQLHQQPLSAKRS